MTPLGCIVNPDGVDMVKCYFVRLFCAIKKNGGFLNRPTPIEISFFDL